MVSGCAGDKRENSLSERGETVLTSPGRWLRLTRGGWRRFRLLLNKGKRRSGTARVTAAPATGAPHSYPAICRRA